MARACGCRLCRWKPTTSGAYARKHTRAARSDSREKPKLCRLLEAELAALEVDGHAVAAQEPVADDAAHLEPEQRAGRVQVEHHHREVVVADRVEREADP